MAHRVYPTRLSLSLLSGARAARGGNPSALDPQRVQSPGTHGHLPQGQSPAHKGMQGWRDELSLMGDSGGSWGS